MAKLENVIIIGAGPAGISAALYLARGNTNPLLIYDGTGALEKAEKSKIITDFPLLFPEESCLRQAFLRQRLLASGQ